MSAGLPLADLLPDVDAVPPGLRVTGLSQDSRDVAAGDAFLAIPGFGTHGLRFVDQARAAGAAAIIYEPPAPAGMDIPEGAIAVPGLRARIGAMADRLHAAPSAAMTVVGVTGTNGKTSTVQMLAQAWSLGGLRAGSIGTLGAGLHGRVEPTGFTTPQVSRMHALLAQLRGDGAQVVRMPWTRGGWTPSASPWACSPTSPATTSTTTATWTPTARPRRACSRPPACARRW